MRVVLLSSLALTVSACSDGTPPSAYKHFRDQFWEATGLHGPCFRTIDGMPGRLPDAECYRLEEPQSWSGVAVIGFETGRFFPELTSLPSIEEQSRYWIAPERDTLPESVRAECDQGCALRLDFVGRRTTVEGAYGHMGLAKHIIIVDRILDATILE